MQVQEPLAVIEFSESLGVAKDPFKLFQDFIEERGGKGFLYGFSGLSMERDKAHTPGSVFFHDTYSADWHALRDADSSLQYDHTVELLFNGAQIVEWIPENLNDYLANLTPEHMRQFADEHDLGMRYGCSLALENGRAVFSGLGYWHEDVDGPQRFRAAWQRFGGEITGAARLLDLHIRQDRPNLVVGLSPRERDCLGWLACGYRPAEICEKLGISERTFEKHILNAKIKLKARTRDNAVAKAVLFRLIDL